LHNSAYADLHTYYGNPLIDTEGNLLADSPAIGAGVPVDGLTEDFYGNQRTSTVDIGAIASTSTPPPTNNTVYEDAEDGNIIGWSIYDNDPAGATIHNLYNNEKQSKIIALQGNGTENGFIHHRFVLVGSTDH